MYRSYVNENGQFHTNPIKEEDVFGFNPSGTFYYQRITKLTTPKVKLYAQEHYHCGSIDGVEVENFGGSGTAGSHWEARVKYCI